MCKRLVLISIFFFPILIESTGNASNPNVDTFQPEPTSGVYFIHGTIIEYTYDFPWPQWGGEKVILNSDTTTISFVTSIQMVEEKQDTVQFFGLAGANASRNSVLPVECDNPSYCGYATFKMGLFQFNYRTPAGEFTGTGQLEGEILTLDTYFEYREIGLEYDLHGKKISEGEF